MSSNSVRRNRESRQLSFWDDMQEDRTGKSTGHTTVMDGWRQSDGCIVPQKPTNNPPAGGAEWVEGRRPTEGKAGRAFHTPDTGPETGMSAVLSRLRDAVRRDKTAKLTALYHHVYNEQHLREAYYSLRRQAASGIDGITWQAYGANLTERVADLAQRLRDRAYRPQPSKRVYIAKADDSQRPLGIPALEDKIVQKVVAELLTVIWEEEFLGFSYGFRPGRNAHNALDAVTVGIERKGVRWVLDADLRAYYDSLSHEWLVRMIEHRIGDKRLVYLIQRWLKAGVMIEGTWQASAEGTPQGGVVSPILANIYLHYVFDQWTHQWRAQHAKGAVIVVRYADDWLMGFAYEEDAQQFHTAVEKRLAQFDLQLNETKTRLIEFGRYAAARRQRAGLGKPETFDFLGFTHICGRTRRGRYTVKRKTIRKRMRQKLKDVKAELKRRPHQSLAKQGAWLRRVLLGHYEYYGVPGNSDKMGSFRYQVSRIWKRSVERRSQRGHVTEKRMGRYSKRWLPYPRITQPYPSQRLLVRT